MSYNIEKFKTNIDIDNSIFYKQVQSFDMSELNERDKREIIYDSLNGYSPINGVVELKRFIKETNNMLFVTRIFANNRQYSNEILAIYKNEFFASHKENIYIFPNINGKQGRIEKESCIRHYFTDDIEYIDFYNILRDAFLHNNENIMRISFASLMIKAIFAIKKSEIDKIKEIVQEMHAMDKIDNNVLYSLTRKLREIKKNRYLYVIGTSFYVSKSLLMFLYIMTYSISNNKLNSLLFGTLESIEGNINDVFININDDALPTNIKDYFLSNKEYLIGELQGILNKMYFMFRKIIELRFNDGHIRTPLINNTVFFIDGHPITIINQIDYNAFENLSNTKKNKIINQIHNTKIMFTITKNAYYKLNNLTEIPVDEYLQTLEL